MDPRFSNATSSLASAALKLCTELANYWRTVLADQGSPYRPELARPWSGARPRPVCAIRHKGVGFALMNPGIAPRARGRVRRALHPADQHP